MNIVELKQNIIDKTIDTLYIFRYSDNSFLCEHYLHKISELLQLPVSRCNEINDLLSLPDSLYTEIPTQINVCDQSEIIDLSAEISFNHDYNIIITKKISKDFEQKFSSQIIDFPVLTDWQILDYIKGICTGLTDKQAEILLNYTNKDIFRIQSELDKFKLFSPAEQKILFDTALSDNFLSDMTSYTIFNLSNALIKKDITAITNIQKEIDKIDINEIGFVNVLYTNFKNIANIQLSRNATAETFGMSQKQFIAIKYQTGIYSAKQLEEILLFLGDIDYQIKTGNLPVNILISYVLNKILVIAQSS